MDAPGADLDEEQDVERPKQDRLDREEIAGEDAFCLGPQELRPGGAVTSWRGADPRAAEDGSDRGGSYPLAETLELTLDADAAPSRVVLRHLDDQGY
jgi:hypothetical protein